MRPSLIPGLAAAAQKNADRGIADVGLFEVGQIFKGDQPDQQFIAAAACAGPSPNQPAPAAIGRARPPR